MAVHGCWLVSLLLLFAAVLRGETTEVIDRVNLTVRVEQGALQGRRVESAAGGFFYSFQGVPYAKPPVGPLRFKDAENPIIWNGVREAFTEGSHCSQPRTALHNQGHQGSEDCLFLNVYTPALPPLDAHPLPVMVWFHGGGFIYGHGNHDTYGPDYLISDGVIVVTVNYRLGVFGFLYLNEAAPGNVGLKDQVAALRWVQRNIAAFGGDPAKVTIFGESAGGASVHLHMLSPMTEGLFHAAIAQSGNALNPWGIQTAPAETTRRLATAVDCPVGNDSATVDCLRGVSVEALVTAANTQAATEEVRDRILKFTFVPTVDLPVTGVETFLPAPPLQLIYEGRHHPVPFLTGINTNESVVHLLMRNFYDENVGHNLDSSWNTTIFPELRLHRNGLRSPQEALESLRNFFMNGEPLTNATMPGFMNLLSDISFCEGVYYSVRHMAQYNTTPLYLYSFNVDDSLNFGKVFFRGIKYSGASHADDLGYIFRIPLLPEASQNSTASIKRAQMVRLWTNFAKFRNPTPSQDPLLQASWLAYGETKNFMEIGSELHPKTDLYHERVEFWKNFYDTFSA